MKPLSGIIIVAVVLSVVIVLLWLGSFTGGSELVTVCPCTNLTINNGNVSFDLIGGTLQGENLHNATILLYGSNFIGVANYTQNQNGTYGTFFSARSIGNFYAGREYSIENMKVPIDLNITNTIVVVWIKGALQNSSIGQNTITFVEGGIYRHTVAP